MVAKIKKILFKQEDKKTLPRKEVDIFRLKDIKEEAISSIVIEEEEQRSFYLDEDIHMWDEQCPSKNIPRIKIQ